METQESRDVNSWIPDVIVNRVIKALSKLIWC